MKHLHSFSVSAQLVSLLTTSCPSKVDGIGVRWIPSNAQQLSNICHSMPDRYLSTIFSTEKTGISGDIYSAYIDNTLFGNCYIILAVRGSRDDNTPVMKTDTFVISANSESIPCDVGYPCYHLDCPGRYQDVSEYQALRDSLSPGEQFNLYSPQLSSVWEPMKAGVIRVNSKSRDQ